MYEVANEHETENRHEFEKGTVFSTVFAVEEIAEWKGNLVVENECIYDFYDEDYDQYDLEDKIDAEISRNLHS